MCQQCVHYDSLIKHMNRGDIVTLINPETGFKFENIKIIGLMNEPSVLVEYIDKIRHRHSLPQRFMVIPQEEYNGSNNQSSNDGYSDSKETTNSE